MLALRKFKKWKNPILEVVKKYHLVFVYHLAKLFILAIYRSFKWINIKYMAKKGLYKTKVFGNVMYIPTSGIGLDIGEESIQKQISLDKEREPQATKVFMEIIKQRNIVLDIGASIGYYTLIAARIVGEQGKVYAIEPSPKNIEILRKNVEANSFEKIVEIHQKAISNQSGKIKLFISDKANLHTTFKSKLVRQKQVNFITSLEVPSITVDEFLNDKTPPDLIKMDIEGAEVEVIKGMKKTLASNKNMYLFIEIHPQLLDDTTLMCDFLETLKNYKFEIKTAISHDDFFRNKIQT